MKIFALFFLSTIILFMAVFQQGHADETLILIDDFESGLTSRWERKDFLGETRYTVVEMKVGKVLRAESRASASGLIYKIKYHPNDYPHLSWRWKIVNTLQKGDARTKQGDDYAARVYVVFPHWIPTLTRSINYIWANKLPKGEIISNTYYAKAMMIAVESGEEKRDQWITETRNVVEDYKRCFGNEPPMVGAIAIMTDTDNTGESAVAYYDDILITQ